MLSKGTLGIVLFILLLLVVIGGIFLVFRKTEQATSPLERVARLAVIIDRVGASSLSLQALLDSPWPLTFAIEPRRERSHELADQALDADKEVLISFRVETQRPKKRNPIPIRLFAKMDALEIDTVLSGALEEITAAQGLCVTNLGGLKKGTLRVFLAELKSKKLILIDASRKNPTGTLIESSRGSLEKQLWDLVKMTRNQKRQACIVHMDDPSALKWILNQLPALEAQNIRLVFASEIMK
jgi:polysaccharide deacetylase 2 family uncharacterized protein YibQ